MNNEAPHLLDNPKQFGVSEEMLVRLRGPSIPRHLPYLDLLSGEAEVQPDAVIEVNGRAALYLISGADPDNLNLDQLRDILACRADARYFGIIEPGILQIFPIGLFGPAESPQVIRKLSLGRESTALHDFLIGHVNAQTDDRRKRKSASADAAWLDNYLLRLLQSTASSLRESCPLDTLSNGQVLSLVGRGLFTRFIADRKIIHDGDAASISSHAQTLEGLFSTPASAADTFAWLDQTFNGNLLPLIDGVCRPGIYGDFFHDIGDQAAQKICKALGDIMRRAASGQLSLGWQRIRFQHVPADMLSQVYEHFAHAYQQKYAEETSIHYTPRHIAQILVDAAFAGLQIDDRSQAKILDPAVGAGVFLVLAFKRLVRERWEKNHERPSRHEIRQILKDQLCGFDVNTESLKFAALSLYLTALELDPDPTPLSELRFDRLDEKSLIYVGQGKGHKQINVGSLSEFLPQALNKQFDVVIGNPPWTRQGADVGLHFNSLVRRIAREKGLTDEVVKNLEVGVFPDIPFVWRALEWAKPGGMIAFALHAQHLLFRQGKGARMRHALLECLELTGIMNGSAIRNEKAIWPTITAPFCLLLARNCKPRNYAAFHYLNPFIERQINQQGKFRLDPQTAVPVEQKLAQESAYLFKTIFRGTWLDHNIVERLIKHPNVCPLAEYWKLLKLKNGKGFQVVKKTGKPNSALHLWDMKMLESGNGYGLQLNINKLPDFNYSVLHSPRDPDIYRGPMMLFREAPKPERRLRGGILATGDVVFSESFIGYSCAGYPQGELLARYLQLLSYSETFVYAILMMSSKFGVERDSLLKEDIDLFPVIPLDSLNETQRIKISQLSDQLIGGQEPWESIDDFVASIYDLSATDKQVIRDTLETALPYTEVQNFAQNPPHKQTVEAFAAELVRIALPFAQRMGFNIWAQVAPHPQCNGWRFLRVGFLAAGFENTVSDQLFLTELADHFWASQIRVHVDSSGHELLIGQLAQNRYWTKTRARILALDLIDSDFERLCNEVGGTH